MNISYIIPFGDDAKVWEDISVKHLNLDFINYEK